MENDLETVYIHQDKTWKRRKFDTCQVQNGMFKFGCGRIIDPEPALSNGNIKFLGEVKNENVQLVSQNKEQINMYI